MATPFGERTEEERPLGSWKEISRYLNCSLRTCQRWERDLDLPIHRLDGTPKARVFAYKEELDRWLKEKLNHSDELREQRVLARPRLNKWLLVSAGGVFILAAGAYLIARFFYLPLPPLPEHKPSLAILPFANSSGDESLEGWMTAFPDLIITDIAQSRIVNVVPIMDLYRSLVALKLGEAVKFTDDDLKRIAEKAGIDYVATGTFLKNGRGSILSVSVKAPRTGEAPRSIRADLRGVRGVFAAADDLTKGIKRVLDLDKKRLSRDLDRNVDRVSTASHQAFLLFSQGIRLVGIEKYQEGIVLLQKAVEFDPKFALAYKHLWRACMKTLRETDERTYIQKAVAYASRLSEKERGDLATLFYRDYKKDPVKEKEALKRLWRNHPDDRFGGIQLMAFYREQEDWRNVLSVAEQGLAANSHESIFCDGLVRSSENLGEGDRAEKALNEFIDSNPGHPHISNLLVLRLKSYLLHNQPDAALKVLDVLDTRFPNRRDSFAALKAIAHMCRADFSAADAELQNLLAHEEPGEVIEARLLISDLCLLQGRIGDAISHLRSGIETGEKAEYDSDRRIIARIASLHHELAYLLRIKGDHPEALREVEEALRLNDQQPGASPALEGLHLKALLFLEMGRSAEFEAQTEGIRQLVEKGKSPRQMRYYYHLLGHDELKKGNVGKATEYFWRALDLLSVPGFELDGADPEFLFSLGMAYDLTGKMGNPRALKMYEKVLLPTVNRLHKGDLYVRSFYRLARIFDRLAQSEGARAEEIQYSKAKAIEHYRTFLELWKNADPIFSVELADASQRLAFLELR